MNPLFILIGVAALGGVAYAASSGDLALGDVISNIPSEPVDPFNQWDPLFKTYSSRYKVPWRWMKAVGIVESGLGSASSVAEGIVNPSDVNGSMSSDHLSWGLMQETLATAGQFEPGTTAQDLNNPETSIRISAKYFKWIMDNYYDDEESIIRSYNGGHGFSLNSTNNYWAKYKSAMATVLSKNPGDRNEIV